METETSQLKIGQLICIEDLRIDKEILQGQIIEIRRSKEDNGTYYRLDKGYEIFVFDSKDKLK